MIVLDNNRKKHFAIIATYPEMAKSLIEIAKEQDVILHDYYASFEDAVDIALSIEHKVDAIFSRGGTAALLKAAISTPVITIPITPFDLTLSISMLPKVTKEIAFMNFNRKIFGVDAIERLFNIKIHELTFRDRSDIEKEILNIKRKGINTLIGGNVAVEYARSVGLTGIEITTGKEAIHKAFYEALDLVQATLEEKKKTTRLGVAFNSISEGILITDEKKNIYICNTSAANLLGLDADDVLGKKVDQLLSDDKIDSVFKTGKAEHNHLLKLNNITTNMSHTPINLGGKFIGVASTIEDVTKIQNLEGQIRNKLSDKGFYAKHVFSDIITRNSELIKIKELAMLYATTPSTVLIEGESGTGKELFAQSIHNASYCSVGPFVAVNCAAIPEQLLESELFGYEGGAFTGAKREGKIGLFELANNGTIFLDEIGEIPRTLQSRLLRVLQEKEIMRVGGSKMIPINVRVIGATNINLKEKVRLGEYREDLYYRLNVFNVNIPPLRNRKEDIELICIAFMDQWKSPLSESAIKFFHEKILPILLAYNWPGNIRELSNIMERLAFFLKGKISTIDWEELLNEIRISSNDYKTSNQMSIAIPLDIELKDAIAKVEKSIIENMLKRHDSNQDIVANKLGIGRTTLWRKLNADNE